MVLPTFLGAVVVGLAIWNVKMTGTIKDNETDIGTLIAERDYFKHLSENLDLDLVVEKKQTERLLSDLTKAAAILPKRDETGRFRKKTSC